MSNAKHRFTLDDPEVNAVCEHANVEYHGDADDAVVIRAIGRNIAAGYIDESRNVLTRQGLSRYFDAAASCIPSFDEMSAAEASQCYAHAQELFNYLVGDATERALITANSVEVTKKEEHERALQISREGTLKIMDSVRKFIAENAGRFVVATYKTMTTAVRIANEGSFTYNLDNWFAGPLTFPDRKSAEKFADYWNSNLTADQRGSVCVKAMTADEFTATVLSEAERTLRFVDELLPAA